MKMVKCGNIAVACVCVCVKRISWVKGEERDGKGVVRENKWEQGWGRVLGDGEGGREGTHKKKQATQKKRGGKKARHQKDEVETQQLCIFFASWAFFLSELFFFLFFLRCFLCVFVVPVFSLRVRVCVWVRVCSHFSLKKGKVCKKKTTTTNKKNT